MPSFITHMMSIWNAATIILALAMTVIAVVRWKSLPEKLPGRYDMDGRPETWTDRRVVWFYPIITLAMLAVMATDGEQMAPVSLFFAAMLLYQMLRTLAIADRRAARRAARGTDRRAERLPPWFAPVLIFGFILLVLLIKLT